MAGSNDLEANRVSLRFEGVDDTTTEKPVVQGTGSRLHPSVYIMYVNPRIMASKFDKDISNITLV
jgi:hypothetical protein